MPKDNFKSAYSIPGVVKNPNVISMDNYDTSFMQRVGRTISNDMDVAANLLNKHAFEINASRGFLNMEDDNLKKSVSILNEKIDASEQANQEILNSEIYKRDGNGWQMQTMAELLNPYNVAINTAVNAATLGTQKVGILAKMGIGGVENIVQEVGIQSLKDEGYKIENIPRDFLVGATMSGIFSSVGHFYNKGTYNTTKKFENTFGPAERPKSKVNEKTIPRTFADKNTKDEVKQNIDEVMKNSREFINKNDIQEAMKEPTLEKYILPKKEKKLNKKDQRKKFREDLKEKVKIEEELKNKNEKIPTNSEKIVIDDEAVIQLQQMAENKEGLTPIEEEIVGKFEDIPTKNIPTFPKENRDIKFIYDDKKAKKFFDKTQEVLKLADTDKKAFGQALDELSKDKQNILVEQINNFFNTLFNPESEVYRASSNRMLKEDLIKNINDYTKATGLDKDSPIDLKNVIDDIGEDFSLRIPSKDMVTGKWKANNFITVKDLYNALNDESIEIINDVPIQKILNTALSVNYNSFTNKVKKISKPLDIESLRDKNLLPDEMVKVINDTKFDAELSNIDVPDEIFDGNILVNGYNSKITENDLRTVYKNVTEESISLDNDGIEKAITELKIESKNNLDKVNTKKTSQQISNEHIKETFDDEDLMKLLDDDVQKEIIEKIDINTPSENLKILIEEESDILSSSFESKIEIKKELNVAGIGNKLKKLKENNIELNKNNSNEIFQFILNPLEQGSNKISNKIMENLHYFADGETKSITGLVDDIFKKIDDWNDGAVERGVKAYSNYNKQRNVKYTENLKEKIGKLPPLYRKRMSDILNFDENSFYEFSSNIGLTSQEEDALKAFIDSTNDFLDSILNLNFKNKNLNITDIFKKANSDIPLDRELIKANMLFDRFTLFNRYLDKAGQRSNYKDFMAEVFYGTNLKGRLNSYGKRGMNPAAEEFSNDFYKRFKGSSESVQRKNAKLFFTRELQTEKGMSYSDNRYGQTSYNNLTSLLNHSDIIDKEELIKIANIFTKNGYNAFNSMSKEIDSTYNKLLNFGVEPKEFYRDLVNTIMEYNKQYQTDIGKSFKDETLKRFKTIVEYNAGLYSDVENMVDYTYYAIASNINQLKLVGSGLRQLAEIGVAFYDLLTTNPSANLIKFSKETIKESFKMGKEMAKLTPGEFTDKATIFGNFMYENMDSYKDGFNSEGMSKGWKAALKGIEIKDKAFENLSCLGLLEDVVNKMKNQAVTRNVKDIFSTTWENAISRNNIESMFDMVNLKKEEYNIISQEVLLNGFGPDTIDNILEGSMNDLKKIYLSNDERYIKNILYTKIEGVIADNSRRFSSTKPNLVDKLAINSAGSTISRINARISTNFKLSTTSALRRANSIFILSNSKQSSGIQYFEPSKLLQNGKLGTMIPVLIGLQSASNLFGNIMSAESMDDFIESIAYDDNGEISAPKILSYLAMLPLDALALRTPYQQFTASGLSRLVDDIGKGNYKKAFKSVYIKNPLVNVGEKVYNINDGKNSEMNQQYYFD